MQDASGTPTSSAPVKWIKIIAGSNLNTLLTDYLVGYQKDPWQIIPDEKASSMASQKHTKALFDTAISFYSEWVVLFCSVIWAVLGSKVIVCVHI